MIQGLYAIFRQTENTEKDICPLRASWLEVKWTFWKIAQNLNSQSKLDNKLSCHLPGMKEQRSHSSSADWSQTLGLFLTAPSLSDFCSLPVSYLTQDTQQCGFTTLWPLTGWQMALSGFLSLSVVTGMITQKGNMLIDRRERRTNTHVEKAPSTSSYFATLGTIGEQEVKYANVCRTQTVAVLLSITMIKDIKALCPISVSR